jgi:hypothetical protein
MGIVILLYGLLEENNKYKTIQYNTVQYLKKLKFRTNLGMDLQF